MSSAEKRKLSDLHAEGKSAYRIAKDLGRSRATVTKHAAEMGLSFAREQTAAATSARVADLAAFRAAEAEALARDAQRLREQLWQPYTAWSIGGRENVYTEHQLDKPDVRSQRDIILAAKAAHEISIKLTEATAGRGDADAASLLHQLGEAFQRVGDYPDDAA
jgi:hypothetical protein